MAVLNKPSSKPPPRCPWLAVADRTKQEEKGDPDLLHGGVPASIELQLEAQPCVCSRGSHGLHRQMVDLGWEEAASHVDLRHGILDEALFSVMGGSWI